MISLASRQAGSITVGTTPDYQRVIDAIEEQIADGRLRPGDRLPSIRQLALDHRTGETTVKTALAILRSRGVIRGHQGRATFVAESSGAEDAIAPDS